METIKVKSGADLRLDYTWRDESGAAIPLQSADVIEASPDISSRLSVASTDLPNGEFQILLEGTDPIARGAYWFNVQVLLASGDTDATGRVVINVS